MLSGATKPHTQWCCVTVGTVTCSVIEVFLDDDCSLIDEQSSSRNTSPTLNVSREVCVVVILHSYVCRIHNDFTLTHCVFCNHQ